MAEDNYKDELFENAALLEEKASHIPFTALRPFENIALGLSGGGFRAASFSLGILKFLEALKIDEDKTLLHNVIYISSTSGGTITSTTYALSSISKKPFQEYYNNLKAQLTSQYLLEYSLKMLNESKWINEYEHKRHNIINSFAIAYNDNLLNNKKIADLIKDNDKSHLEELCFNASEFYAGRPFRMQFLLDPNDHTYLCFGNWYAELKYRAVINKIKLADCLASSACFPTGFEPMVYPEDFTNEQLDKETLLNSMFVRNPYTKCTEPLSKKENKEISLMDGGITDNQAIVSMLNSDIRRKRPEKMFHLMLLGDVTSHYMEQYITPKPIKNKILNNISLSSLKLFSYLFILVLFIAITSIYNEFPIFPITILVLIFFLGTLAITYLGIYLAIYISLFGWKSLLGKKKLREEQSLKLSGIFKPEVLKLLTHYFDQSSLATIINILLSRLTSTIEINLSVFLKRIRSLLYEAFYSNKKWMNRRKMIAVYDLSVSNIKKVEEKIYKWKEQIHLFKTQGMIDYLNIPDKRNSDLFQIAEKAFRMPTTLWFESDEDKSTLRDLLATGNFTTCYKLLDHIIDLRCSSDFIDLNQTSKSLLDKLQTQLEDHWIGFNTEPYKMVDDPKI